MQGGKLIYISVIFFRFVFFIYLLTSKKTEIVTLE